MAVDKLGVGRISFPYEIDDNLRFALEDLVRRLDDNINYLHKPRVNSVTGATTLTDGDYAVLGDTTGGAFSVTLPEAATVTGKIFSIKRTSAGANDLTVDGAGSEEIDGSTTYVLDAQYKYVQIQSDGTGWNIISNN